MKVVFKKISPTIVHAFCNGRIIAGIHERDDQHDKHYIVYFVNDDVYRYDTYMKARNAVTRSIERKPVDVV